jgi:hypothetical protein
MDPVMGDLPLPGLPESTNNSNPQLQKVATIDCQNAPNLALKCVKYENTRSLQNTLKVCHRLIDKDALDNIPKVVGTIH